MKQKLQRMRGMVQGARAKHGPSDIELKLLAALKHAYDRLNAIPHRYADTDFKKIREAIVAAEDGVPMYPWTVLLLRPDYAAGTFGHDTILLHVEGATAKNAVDRAKVAAARID